MKISREVLKNLAKKYITPKYSEDIVLADLEIPGLFQESEEVLFAEKLPKAPETSKDQLTFFTKLLIINELLRAKQKDNMPDYMNSEVFQKKIHMAQSKLSMKKLSDRKSSKTSTSNTAHNAEEPALYLPRKSSLKKDQAENSNDRPHTPKISFSHQDQVREVNSVERDLVNRIENVTQEEVRKIKRFQPSKFSLQS